MPRPPRRPARPSPASDAAGSAEAEATSPPRIIGGDLRRRRLAHSPDGRTRPMKDRVRESLFDLLGTDVRRALALDLFAGTGALGFEAISRGAAKAVFMERHFPTADTIRRSAAELGVADRCDVRAGDVLLWSRRMPDLPRDLPWVVFVSPPWAFFAADHPHRDDVMKLWSRAEVLRLTNIRANQMRKMGDPGPEGSIGKMASANLNKDIYDEVVNLLGAEGMLYGSYEMVRPETAMGFDTMQKAFLRSRANSIEGGTTEVMLNILGERVLGLPGDVRVDRDVPWSKVPRN